MTVDICKYYESKLQQRLDDVEKKMLFKAVEEYGASYVAEAIVLTSFKPHITSGHLNYVLAVCHNLQKQDKLEAQEFERRQMRIEAAKMESQEANDELAAKLNKARRRKG